MLNETDHYGYKHDYSNKLPTGNISKLIKVNKPQNIRTQKKTAYNKEGKRKDHQETRESDINGGHPESFVIISNN